MINDRDKSALIKYRLEQAKETIKEVNKLIENDLLKIAVNRIYYGIYYSLIALALEHNFQTSKHLQLIGWFNRDFVRGNLISLRYGKILRDTFKNRTDGDYAPFIEFEKEDVLAMYTDMKDFITRIEKLIKSEVE